MTPFLRSGNCLTRGDRAECRLMLKRICLIVLVFLTAVFVFGEPMDKWKLASFVLIWIALATFTISALREGRGGALPVEDPTAA